MLSELLRFAGAPGRRFAGQIVHVDVPDDGEDAEWVVRILEFVRSFAAAAGRAAAGSRRGELPRLAELEGGSSPLADGLSISAASETRSLKSQIVRSLQELEGRGGELGGTLVIIDGLDALLRDATVAEEVRKVLLEVLVRTERTVLLLGARSAPFQALGAHKAVAFQVEPLQPLSAARLFLRRVHRPLTLADLSEAAGDAAKGLPLITTAQNRNMVLEQISVHPLLLGCAGNPAQLRAAADRVLPGSGSLWAMCREDAVAAKGLHD